MNTYTLAILSAILATGLSAVVGPPLNRDSVAETIRGEICNQSKAGLIRLYKSFHSDCGLTQRLQGECACVYVTNMCVQ